MGTVLTNTKLGRELAYHNTALIRTDVGDKNVLDALNKQGALLGGEKSGHIIMLDKSSTGDGLVTALSLLEVKRTLGSLPKYTPYPMLELNVPAKHPADEVTSESFCRKIAEINSRFVKQGRLVVRPSGTEPKLKFYLTAWDSDEKSSAEFVEKMTEFVKNLV